MKHTAQSLADFADSVREQQIAALAGAPTDAGHQFRDPLERPFGLGEITKAEQSGAVVGAAAGFVAVAILATAGVGALVGAGVAAAVAGNKPPQYMKGAAIGAGSVLLLGFLR
jgi:hypothetical protein